jgi:uncharacterized RDD family membrane protein YckC
MCLWCGYQVTGPAEESELNSQENQDSAAAQTAPDELPEWRQQLSQRLQSLKQKREMPDSTPEETEIASSVDMAIPEAKKSSEPAQFAAEGKPAAPQNAEELTDKMPLRQFQQTDTLFKTTLNRVQPQKSLDFNKGLMLLLSRTLSGVVDLFIIGLITGVLLLAADIVSGLKMLGFGSIVNYAVLFLLIYFFYSLFFFRISGQTIGMMITNLRVVAGGDIEHPQVGRILARCFGYLISLFCFGIGLLWAFFDQEHLCFHDRLTNTRVVRS